MKNSIFQFKQFQVDQSKSAMKIGTDGVLLGAWATIENRPKAILDIGTGTGLVALMLAQRSSVSKIIGVEIEKEAALEARSNFKNSPWSERLNLFHTDILRYTKSCEETFSLIVCNPPFFMTPYRVSQNARSTARDNCHLRYQDLFSCVDQLLNPTGNFVMVCPFEYRDELIALGLHHKLYMVQELYIKGNKRSPFKRILMRFGYAKSPLLSGELILEKSRHQRTPEHQSLVQDFYL